ncbi:response regulator, partial [Roseibium polysiphoniae]
MARILLTEDDEAVRSFVQRALELDGHTVKAAEDGAEAVEVLTREQGKFDLLVSDIKMPV